jgi:imidazolonepropionase
VSLLIRNARVVTLHGERPRRGRALGDLEIIEQGDVLLEEGRVAKLGRPGTLERAGSAPPQSIDAAGRVLMPAFVDCHTHACWAGSRLDEWDQKRRGASYLEVLKAGGGIMSTVRATRAASPEELSKLLRARLAEMGRWGTAVAEVKSGYGLTLEYELKMLRAISDLGFQSPERQRQGSGDAASLDPVARAPGSESPVVVPTALLGHAIDPDVPDFVERTIRETLPAVSAEFPGIAIDAFCEQGAWSLDDTVRLLARAKELGHPLRVHADQFNSLGMVGEAVKLGARSVDHLEASTPADLDLLAASSTFGVILPCCGFHLDGRYAQARRFLDAGGLLALATNYNPGSAPCPSIPMAMSLAVRHCGLSPQEAIAATTVNAAEVLGLHDRGQIVPGQVADLLLLRHTDERALAYEFGADPIETIFRAGVPVGR